MRRYHSVLFQGVAENVNIILVRTLRGHSRHVETVAFSSDGKRALTGSSDGTICYWDLANGKTIARYRMHERMVVAVKDVFFAGDGNTAIATTWGHVAMKNYEHAALMLDLSDGSVIRRFTTGGTTLSAHISDSGRYLLTASATVSEWDVTSGVKLFESEQCRNAIVRFHPNEREFFVGSEGAITAYDTMKGEWSPQKYSGVDVSHFGGMEVSSDGSLLIAVDTELHVFNIKTTQELHRLRPSGRRVLLRDVAISPRENLVAGVDQNCVISFWNIGNGWETSSFKAHESCIYTIKFSPDGSHILTGGGDNTACLWKIVG
jgi:WD40 repeat protein